MVRNTIMEVIILQDIPHSDLTNCSSDNMNINSAICDEVALTPELINTHSIQPHSDGNNQILSTMHDKDTKDEGAILSLYQN